MSKRILRLSRGGAVKASLLMFGTSIVVFGCGTSPVLEYEIGDTDTAPCTAFYCSTTGTGGHTGAAGSGGMGGHAGSGGSTTSVGGSGGTSTGTGGSGGSAGATHAGGAGGFGGNTTTNTGGSAGATNVGGSGGSGGMTTTGTGDQGGATTTTTDAGVGGSGGASTTTTDAGILNSFSCSGWTRDPLFDAFKIPDQNNQPADVQLVGGIWGTSGDDFYISAATYAKGVVAHWYGGAFHLEALPSDPPKVRGIWGSGAGDVWLGSESVMQAVLYHRVNGTWTVEANAPNAISFADVWGSDANHVFLLGQDAGFSKVWMKSGANWIDTNLPNPMKAGDLAFAAVHIWGTDASHVFATGYRIDKASNAVGGVLWFYNGVTWKIVQVPVEAMELTGVHGTSPQDLFVTGHGVVVGGNADSYVYHVTDNMATWTPYTRPSFGSYGPVLSMKFGTFLAVGTQPPSIDGSLRVTTVDQISPAQFYALDGKAVGPVALWPESGSSKVHLVHISGGVTIGGHYISNCK